MTALFVAFLVLCGAIIALCYVAEFGLWLYGRHLDRRVRRSRDALHDTLERAIREP